MFVGGYEFLGAGDVGSDGFLAQDVFTGFERLFDDFGLFGDGQGDDDGVNIVPRQQLVETVVSMVDVEFEIVNDGLVERERRGGSRGTRVDGLEVENVGRGLDRRDMGYETGRVGSRARRG